MTRDELATLATRPYALTPKRSHYHALQQALALLDAEVAAHAQTKAHLTAAMGQTGRRC